MQQITELATKRVDRGRVSGLAAGISGRGFRKIIYRGLSDRDRSVPVNERTQFRIASVTKPFIGACALQLEEARKLDIAQPLSDYFPKFPRSEQVTLYQLLTHTSGIANWWGRLPDGTPDDFMNSGRAHEWLGLMTPVYNFEPGTLREYSNSGYVLLGEIIEKATGTSLDRALREYVFSRVGASSTFVELRQSPTKDWALGYTPSLRTAQNVPPPFGAGGLRATAHDVLAFADALFLGPLLEPQNQARMVAHAKVRDGRPVGDAMYVAPGSSPEPQPPSTTEMGYGLGINTWVQAGERFYSHAGLIDGFSSYLVHAPRTGTTAVLLSNTFQGTAPLHQAVRQSMIDAPTT